MITTLVRMLVLVAVSVAAGAVYRIVPDKDGKPRLPWFPSIEERNERQKFLAIVGVSLDEFRRSYESGAAIVVDARAAEEFAKGHLAAPLIVNIPSTEAVANLYKLEPYRGMPILLYCTSDTCEMAEDLYKILQPYGFGPMQIFVAGWDGIKKANLPTATGPDGVPGPADAGAPPPSE